MFYYKNEHEVKTCSWLDMQSNKGDICSEVETDGVYPSARKACPISCGAGSCAVPTNPPTTSPTLQPTISPTALPSESPTAPSNGCKDGDSFYLVAGSRALTKTCSWLKTRTQYCSIWMKWGEINGIVYGPPAFACQEACDSCDPCYQQEKTMFYYKNENEVKTCSWLDMQSNRGDICSEVETDGVYPSASEACPSSCGVGSCEPIVPTNPPTKSPTLPPTASPTAPPTESPTGCKDGDSFYLIAGNRAFLKTCDWLKTRTSFCSIWMNWGEINGVVYGPPAFVCQAVCDSCDPCYQHDKTMFYYKNGNEVKNCSWLDGYSKKEDVCSEGATDGIYPSASEAFPKSCGIGYCSHYL
jgi:ferredoxin